MLDDQDRIIRIDSTSTCHIESINEGIMIGAVDKRAVNGVYIFDTLRLIEPPNTSGHLYSLSSTAIDSILVDKAFPHLGVHSLIEISFRECVAGEEEVDE